MVNHVGKWNNSSEELISYNEDLSESKNLDSELSNKDIKDKKDIVRSTEQIVKKKSKSKRTYDLSKITNHVRTSADVSIGSGKLQKTNKSTSWESPIN